MIESFIREITIDSKRKNKRIKLEEGKVKGDGNCGLYSLLASLKISQAFHLGLRQVICDELMNNYDNERINLGFTGIKGPTDRTSYVNRMRKD